MASGPPEDLRPLTALRAFAAAWVVSYDYLPRLTTHSPPLVARGRLGVEVFFVLSGFILMHVYGRRFAEGRFRYGEFLWARLARIYPVHLATLFGLAMLVGVARLAGANVGEEVARPGSLPAEVLLAHAWGFAPQGGWNHPSWSLSAEWFAYLAFPVFAASLLAAQRRPRLATGLVLVAGASAYTAFHAWTGASLSMATTNFGWLRIVPPFLLGCSLQLVWRTLPRRPEASSIRPALCAAAAVGAGGAAILAGLSDPVVVAAAGALILALAALPARVGQGRAMSVLVYLGEVSFALYMMVMPWQVVYENGLGQLLHRPQAATLSPLVWAGLIAGLLPAAMVLHHLVERPARVILRRMGPPFRRSRPSHELETPALRPAKA